jgi:predicted O-methyltransferase YrrM
MSDGFPDLAEWSAAVVHPDDEGKFRTQRFHDYYRQKYLIAALFAPASIAEIGVRWGYSAWSFLRACPRAAYDGFDLQQGTHGGAKGADTFDWCLQLLARDYPDASVAFHRADTQALDTLGGPYDLIHVDGDHTERGCRHDLDLAWNAAAAGGLILVDDYDYIPGVHAAVDAFCRARPRAGQIAVPSLRGEYLIRKED